jgi:hypothetical protein
MRKMKFLALTAIAGLGIAAGTPRTQAQVSIGIGVAPPARMVIMKPLRTVALPTVITVPSGSRTASLLEPAPGFMARNTSTATSTTATDRITATTVIIRATAKDLVTGGMVLPSTSAETSGATAMATGTNKDTANMAR